MLMFGLAVACAAGQATRAPETPTPPTTLAPASAGDGSSASPPAERCPPGSAAEGCPPLDRDGDGILDGDDKCPDAPEVVNGSQDTDGCPDAISVAFTEIFGAIPKVRFERNSAAIRQAQALLDAVVAVLLEYPGLRLEISGHTAKGEQPAVSLRRAEAVRDYLVAQGVAAERLQVRGAADEEPLGDLRKPENRRVEFMVLESE